jgi:hypothetical protein
MGAAPRPPRTPGRTTAASRGPRGRGSLWRCNSRGRPAPYCSLGYLSSGAVRGPADIREPANRPAFPSHTTRLWTAPSPDRRPKSTEAACSEWHPRRPGRWYRVRDRIGGPPRQPRCGRRRSVGPPWPTRMRKAIPIPRRPQGGGRRYRPRFELVRGLASPGSGRYNSLRFVLPRTVRHETVRRVLSGI